jgi:hypothetical protein
MAFDQKLRELGRGHQWCLGGGIGQLLSKKPPASMSSPPEQLLEQTSHYGQEAITTDHGTTWGGPP